MVDVNAATWRVEGVFLSAHCFGRSGGSCRWYRGSELEGLQWPDGRLRGPRVWVATGRNANYPSRASCDTGHWFIDTCDGERIQYAFPVLPERNIGSRDVPATPGGCIHEEAVDPAALHTDRGTAECPWDADRFGGWQAGVPGVTGYNRYLREIAGM